MTTILITFLMIFFTISITLLSNFDDMLLSVLFIWSILLRLKELLLLFSLSSGVKNFLCSFSPDFPFTFNDSLLSFSSLPAEKEVLLSFFPFHELPVPFPVYFLSGFFPGCFPAPPGRNPSYRSFAWFFLRSRSSSIRLSISLPVFFTSFIPEPALSAVFRIFCSAYSEGCSSFVSSAVFNLFAVPASASLSLSGILISGI